ncbi:MAG: hypothetical protein ABIX01_09095 [Chitinophagaceae bacterium]
MSHAKNAIQPRSGSLSFWMAACTIFGLCGLGILIAVYEMLAIPIVIGIFLVCIVMVADCCTE